jgi:ABC-type multidrug transport system ATPase subunit
MTLAIDDLAHAFGDRVALDGVTFDVQRGRLTGLLGPNGAGKTTLIRILLGVLTPQRGTVAYEGHPVGAQDRRTWTGPQRPPPWPTCWSASTSATRPTDGRRPTRAA